MSTDRTKCAGKYHGTMTAYTRYRCRCPDALADKRMYVKLGEAGIRQPRLVNGAGTRRRLRALAAIGWTYADIAARMGKETAAVQRIARDEHPRVREVTAAAVKCVYADLSMTPGRSENVRRYAARKGWAPPLAWDDDTIDDPDAAPDLGDGRARRSEEVAEEAHFLLGFGLSTHEVARRLGVSEPWIRQLLGGGKRAAA
jgi:transcriptional regulator with XRE-family HTH domain